MPNENEHWPNQTMVKPREPPAVEKPHISEIGMLPQVKIIIMIIIITGTQE